MKNSFYFLTQNLSAGRKRKPEFEKWSHVYTCGLIINKQLLHIVLNVNGFWLYQALHFTPSEIRPLDQNSDMDSVQQGNSFRPFVPKLSHLKMKRLNRFALWS